MIQLALVRNNVGLLGFLSEKGIIPPDYNHFSVKDTQYSSMFDYYFKQADLLKGTPKAAEMVANFKELVKNGLSLLEIDSTSGLPFAAVLLLDPKHPLRPALKGKENLITNNPIFLKKLNQVFRAIADQTACSQENKEKIKLLTQRNQLHLLSLQNLSNHSIGISFEQWDYKYIDEAEKTLGLDLSVLENDAELLTIRMQVEQQMGLVLPKMPLQRAEMCLGIEDFYKQAINKLKEIKQSGTIPTVMDFKRHIIQCHQIRLKGLGLINAMLECEDELSKFKNAPGKKAKKIAEGLKARLNALYKDSEDNNTSYNLALDELKKAAIDSQYQKKLAELHSGKVSALDSVIHNLGSSGKHIGYRAVTAEDLDDDADVEDCGDFLAFSEAHDSSRKEENKSDGKGDGKTASKKTVEVDLTHRFFGASKTSADSSASKPGLGLI
jgi:hypothetical protein